MLDGQLGTEGSGRTTYGGGTSLGTPSPYDDMIKQAADEAGVPPALVKAVAKAESGFNPQAGSPAGAQGLMQLMPGTARGLGVTDPFDPLQSLRGGAKYLRAAARPVRRRLRQGDRRLQRRSRRRPEVRRHPAVRRDAGVRAEGDGLLPGVRRRHRRHRRHRLGARRRDDEPGRMLSIAGGGSVGSTVVAKGLQHLGTPYVWGGSKPGGFDCSGLCQYLYGQEGVQIPRVSQDQFRAGRSVPSSQMQPGDLVFFQKNGDVHHVGIYMGGGKFLHAPHTGDVVKISSLSEPYYRAQFAGARRYA